MKMIFKPLIEAILASQGSTYMKNSLFFSNDVYTLF